MRSHTGKSYHLIRHPSVKWNPSVMIVGRRLHKRNLRRDQTRMMHPMSTRMKAGRDNHTRRTPMSTSMKAGRTNHTRRTISVSGPKIHPTVVLSDGRKRRKIMNTRNHPRQAQARGSSRDGATTLTKISPTVVRIRPKHGMRRNRGQANPGRLGTFECQCVQFLSRMCQQTVCSPAT